MATPRPSYTYEGLLRHLAEGRNKNERPTDVYCLRAHLYGDDVVVRMHRTDLARFKPDGTIELNCGGREESTTTRQRVGEVTGVRVYTTARHNKRSVNQSTRIYAGYQFPYGLPFANGCIIKLGTCIWHPWMKEQGVENIDDLMEEVKVVNKEKAKGYYAARRALLDKINPVLPFVDQRSITGYGEPRNRLDWFEDALFSPIADEDVLDVACQLVALGAPTGNGWQKVEFKQDNVREYVQRGMTKLAGPSSWDILDHLNMIDETRIRCDEV